MNRPRTCGERPEAVCSRSSNRRLPDPRKNSRLRGMTLVEVITAMCLIALTSLSLISASVLSRRLTELAVYQSSVSAIVQGYLEQVKNMPYDQLPMSPAAGTDMTVSTYATLYSVATLKDDTTPDALVVSPLSPIYPSALTPPTVPAVVYDNNKVFDVNRAGDLTVHIWLWIEDKTPAGYTTAQQAKAITFVYMWQIHDGRDTRSYTGIIKNLRSLVPTH